MLKYVAALLSVVAGACAQLGADPLSGPADVEGAFIMASKRITNSVLVATKDITVQYTFINIGNKDVTGLELKEVGFPAQYFTLVHGLETIKFDTIPKQSNVTHVLIYQADKPVTFNMTATNFTYYNGEEKVTGYTSFPNVEFTAYPQESYYIYNSPHTVEWIYYAAGSAVMLVLPLLAVQKSASRLDGGSKKMK
eukprot:comp24501_c0_seq1/m.46752 comp24501_c0_seq1/g.46752  ORF comp24501_c0_seq1/g.46752 comp24501_c0_seq1/m.46752 type:complete len:195 (-) comp24501_c0_seq1:58-642(-)